MACSTPPLNGLPFLRSALYGSFHPSDAKHNRECFNASYPFLLRRQGQTCQVLIYNVLIGFHVGIIIKKTSLKRTCFILFFSIRLRARITIFHIQFCLNGYLSHAVRTRGFFLFYLLFFKTCKGENSLCLSLTSFPNRFTYVLTISMLVCPKIDCSSNIFAPC